MNNNNNYMSPTAGDMNMLSMQGNNNNNNINNNNNKQQTIQASEYEHYSGYPEVTKGQPQPKKYNDVLWSVIFVAHLVLMTGCGISFIPQLKSDLSNYMATNYGYDYQYVNNAVYDDVYVYYNNGGGGGDDDDGNNRNLLNDPNELNDGGIQVKLLTRLMRTVGTIYLKINEQWDGATYENRGLEEEEEGYYSSNSAEYNQRNMTLLVVITLMSSIVLSTLSLGLMIKFAEPLIKCSILMNVVIGAGMIVIGLIKEMPPFIMIGTLVFLFASCYAYYVWNRIPFAASNLVTASTSIKANIGVTVFAWAAIFIGGLWITYWSIASYATMHVLGNCNVASGVCEKDVNGFIVFLLLLSFYWTQQVISNVVHVTVAGTVGTWWWTPFEANSCCSEGVRSSHVRAITTSFGSICLGSLLVAIVQTVRSMLENARENDAGLLSVIADCLLGCLESILEMFNSWAFVYVGLYGYTFTEAAGNVMTLFKDRGWTSIITDYIVDRVIALVSFGMGVIVGSISALVSYSLGMNIEAIAFFCGLIVGMILTAVLLGVVGSAVNTIIVCYAEDPATFETNHFELSSRMRESWRHAFPHDFKY